MSIDTNRRTLERMIAHHRTMAAELGHRVARLAGAAEESHRLQAIEAVRSYLDSDLFPHALAEERTVYAAAAAHGLRELVDEMVTEHLRLGAEEDRLASSGTGDDAVDTAGRIASLFASHAEKENASILPPLADDPNVDLESLLGDMEGMLAAGEGRCR